MKRSEPDATEAGATGGARRRPRVLPAPDPADARRSSGQLAAEYIRTLIVSGELRADERIPQDEIADALDLSRIPLREGLIALEREGLIRIELNRGAFVNRFDADAVRDHFELYGLTYGLAIRRALARSGTDLAEALGDIVDTLQHVDDPAEFLRWVLAFHAVIVEAARSPRITASLKQAPRLLAGNIFAEVPSAQAIERAGLKAIVKAVRARDAEAASEAYVGMLRRQGEAVATVLAARGAFSGR